MDNLLTAINPSDVVFYVFAIAVIAFGAMVAFGRNIIYSGFSLLGCFTAIAGLYILLGADFVGVLQMFVYVGGITVLLIFAVMFTSEIGDVKISNQSINWKVSIPTMVLLFALLQYCIRKAPWHSVDEKILTPTTERLGDMLLSLYLLPFELISLVLLVVLIGAVVIARREAP